MHPVHTAVLSKAEKRAMWDKILNEFAQSDLVAAAFCREHQIKYDNFAYYLHEQRRKKSSKFIKVSTSAPPTTTSSHIKIVTDKLTIHIPANLTAEQITNIVKGVSAGC